MRHSTKKVVKCKSSVGLQCSDKHMGSTPESEAGEMESTGGGACPVVRVNHHGSISLLRSGLPHPRETNE